VTLLLAVLAGLVYGGLAGGHASGLRDQRIRGEVALLLVLALQAVTPLFSAVPRNLETVAFGLWVVSLGLTGAIAVLNWRQTGMLAVATGTSTNLIVIVLNRGMPVSASAMVAAGYVGDPTVGFSGGFTHHLLTPGTLLPVLSDVLPIPGPDMLQTVVSVGDVVLMVGIAAFVMASMCQRNPGVTEPYVGRHRKLGSPLRFTGQ
jgi:hypothetical protein